MESKELLTKPKRYLSLQNAHSNNFYLIKFWLLFYLNLKSMLNYFKPAGDADIEEYIPKCGEWLQFRRFTYADILFQKIAQNSNSINKFCTNLLILSILLY